MKNPITDSFWSKTVGSLAFHFKTLTNMFTAQERYFLQTELSILKNLTSIFGKEIPAIQVQAVEALFALDMLNEYEQWEILGDLFENEKNFDHLILAFAEYKSALLLYGQELLPHQKTILIKKCVELYPDIDRIDFNI